jgi:hypothetical protein
MLGSKGIEVVIDLDRCRALGPSAKNFQMWLENPRIGEYCRLAMTFERLRLKSRVVLSPKTWRFAEGIGFAEAMLNLILE